MKELGRVLMLLAIVMAIMAVKDILVQIEHDLSVIAVEQIKIEHQENVENQSAYVKR